MSCSYGCPQDNIEEKCVNCGHPKKHHAVVHPHRCLGVYPPDSQSPIKSCTCTQFQGKEK